MRTPTVLFVDDEKEILRSFESLFVNDNYRVMTAGDGMEALDLLSKHEVAVMLCDQRMPGMSGAKVLSEAKKLSPNTVRIAVTSFSSVDTIIKCINECEVSRFMLKPWNGEALKRVVKESISQYWMASEVQRLSCITQEQHVRMRNLNVSLEKEVREKTMELRGLRFQLEKIFREVAVSLSEMMELHAPVLSHHSRKTAELSTQLAEKLSMPIDQVVCVEAAALLHDIGKIAIKPQLLEESFDNMSSTDKRFIQRHPLTGSAILKNISGFKEIARMVRHHHEAYSGGGYPDELNGDDIPEESRIIAVVDTYVNLKNPVNNSYPAHRDVLDALKRQAGAILDPAYVDVFTKQVLEGEKTRQPN